MHECRGGVRKGLNRYAAYFGVASPLVGNLTFGAKFKAYAIGTKSIINLDM